MSQPNEFRDNNSVYRSRVGRSEIWSRRRIAWDPESIEFFPADDVPKMLPGSGETARLEAYYEVEKERDLFSPSRQVIREEYIGPEGEVILGDVCPSRMRISVFHRRRRHRDKEIGTPLSRLLDVGYPQMPENEAGKISTQFYLA